MVLLKVYRRIQFGHRRIFTDQRDHDDCRVWRQKVAFDDDHELVAKADDVKRGYRFHVSLATPTMMSAKG